MTSVRAQSSRCAAADHWSPPVICLPVSFQLTGVYVRAWVRACVRACVCARVRARVCECVYVRACVLACASARACERANPARSDRGQTVRPCPSSGGSLGCGTALCSGAVRMSLWRPAKRRGRGRPVLGRTSRAGVDGRLRTAAGYPSPKSLTRTGARVGANCFLLKNHWAMRHLV